MARLMALLVGEREALPIPCVDVVRGGHGSGPGLGVPPPLPGVQHARFPGTAFGPHGREEVPRHVAVARDGRGVLSREVGRVGGVDVVVV